VLETAGEDEKAGSGTRHAEAAAGEAGKANNELASYTADPLMEQALRDASLEGQSDVITGLIGKGINVNASDAEGRTALMYASFNGHGMIVQSLLDAGAVVSLRDAAGRTALLYASTGPFPETVKLLLEHNADPNTSDAVEAFTPLMHAAAEGQLEVVEILLEYGADPDRKDIDGETAYMFALHNGHEEVVALLGSKR
jgi:ankyrin repeat protein